MGRLRFLLTLSLCVPVGTSLVAAADLPAAVPDTRRFLEEVRQNLQSDEMLLDQYTFTEVFRESRLDSKGAVKKTKTEVYEVYPSIVPRKIYRRLISRDGTPLTEAELAEQDRKQEEKTERREQRIAAHDAAASESHAEENRRKERAIVDEIFRMDDIGVVGRETVDGRPAIIVSFTPRPGYKPVTEGGKTIQKLAGRAWIDEADRQLVRLEAKLVDTIGVGPAKLARLQKGATAFFQRKKVNDEVWLPAEAHFAGAAKALLLFGTRIDVHSTYSNYKKFSVSTEEDVSATSPEGATSPQ
ncbi:MAG TPA: hypothetical protein VGH97_03385 [Thermoanaerobaculia bacterium]|jgi:hypothetical protein